MVHLCTVLDNGHKCSDLHAYNSLYAIWNVSNFVALTSYSNKLIKFSRDLTKKVKPKWIWHNDIMPQNTFIHHKPFVRGNPPAINNRGREIIFVFSLNKLLKNSRLASKLTCQDVRVIFYWGNVDWTGYLAPVPLHISIEFEIRWKFRMP